MVIWEIISGDIDRAYEIILNEYEKYGYKLPSTSFPYVLIQRLRFEIPELSVDRDVFLKDVKAVLKREKIFVVHSTWNEFKEEWGEMTEGNIVKRSKTITK